MPSRTQIEDVAVCDDCLLRECAEHPMTARAHSFFREDYCTIAASCYIQLPPDLSELSRRLENPDSGLVTQRSLSMGVTTMPHKYPDDKECTSTAWPTCRILREVLIRNSPPNQVRSGSRSYADSSAYHFVLVCARTAPVRGSANGSMHETIHHSIAHLFRLFTDQPATSWRLMHGLEKCYKWPAMDRNVTCRRDDGRQRDLPPERVLRRNVALSAPYGVT